jgi:ATP-dependent RNA helicase RhlE
MLFSEMKLQDEIKSALAKKGYVTPTAIQEQVIDLALSGKNIVGQSQTGTGKTAAFVIPLLELVDGRVRRPQAIILAPTRELASQIRDEVFNLSDGMRLRSTVLVGGTSFKKQRENIDMGPQIVIATPGRLIDLIDKRFIDLAQVKYFVLDECDRMLDMGFVDDIDYIWGHLPKVEQSMTFSATIPEEMKRLLGKYVGDNYENIKATQEVTVAKIDHSFIEVETFDKFALLKKYIDEAAGKKVIVFSRTKHETEHLARVLMDNGVAAGFLHGDMEQRHRTRALRAFKDNEVQVFVTTDVAARGLNMNDIDLVINFHVPEDPEAYIHRIGRTGRAGAEGRAVMFVSPSEKMMLRNVEKRNKIVIKQIDLEGNEVERTPEDPRRGFGGGGGRSRGRGGRGGYRGGRGSGSGGYYSNESSGGGYQGGGTSSGGGYQGGRSSSGGYQGGGRSGGGYGRDGGAASSGGGYQGGNRGGRGGYQGGGTSSGGGYQGGRSSSGGYQGGGRSGGAPSSGGQSGGDFSVFGG